jgi:hypothetical protein
VTTISNGARLTVARTHTAKELMMRNLVLHSAAFALLAMPLAMAHQPTVSDGSAVNAESAIEFENVQISRVVYHEMNEQALQLWLTFEVDQPQELRLQLGVPFIERLEDYRPALALLGPGLPAVDVPLEIPDGLGGVIFDTRDVTEPEVFDEPFSGTTSWIISETDVQLPSAGRYYVVAYHPSAELGKLWVALGSEEVFELDDLLELPDVLAQVRAFHEVSESAAPPCFLFPLAAGLTGFWFLRRVNRSS